MIRTTRGRHTMMNNEFRIYEGSSLTTYTTQTEKEWLLALQRFLYYITRLKTKQAHFEKQACFLLFHCSIKQLKHDNVIV